MNKLSPAITGDAQISPILAFQTSLSVLPAGSIVAFATKFVRTELPLKEGQWSVQSPDNSFNNRCKSSRPSASEEYRRARTFCNRRRMIDSNRTEICGLRSRIEGGPSR